MNAAKLWTLNYRLVSTIITSVAPEIAALGLEVKELFLLSSLDEFPHPAALSDTLCIPKPTVTVHIKKLEALGFVRRDIDPTDLRRPRLTMTPAGRKAMTRGQALLSNVFGERLDRLTSDEQHQFMALLERMS